MSIITEVKRKAARGEFAALTVPNNIESLENVGGLYLEITGEQFDRLQKLAALIPGNKEEFGVSDFWLTAKASNFFNRMTLLDSTIQDTEQLMLLVDQSNFKAIPPIEQHILAILEDSSIVDWHLEIRNDAGKLSLIIYGNVTGGGNVDFLLDTDQLPLERFDPDSMRKDFFVI